MAHKSKVSYCQHICGLHLLSFRCHLSSPCAVQGLRKSKIDAFNVFYPHTGIVLVLVGYDFKVYFQARNRRNAIMI